MIFKKIAAFFKGATSIGDVLDKLRNSSQEEIDDLVINKLPDPVFDMVYDSCLKRISIRKAMGK